MITTDQIRNVLRVYGNQLRKKNALLNDSVTPVRQPSDFVEISIEARSRQMLNKMSDNLISEIISKKQEDQGSKEDIVADQQKKD